MGLLYMLSEFGAERVRFPPVDFFRLSRFRRPSKEGSLCLKLRLERPPTSCFPPIPCVEVWSGLDEASLKREEAIRAAMPGPREPKPISHVAGARGIRFARFKVLHALFEPF